VFAYVAAPLAAEMFSWLTAAILLVSIGLVIHAARRGSAFVPAYVGASCLLLAQAVAVECDRHDPAQQAIERLGGRAAHWLVGPSSGSPLFGKEGLEGLFHALERRGFVAVAESEPLSEAARGLAILIDAKLPPSDADHRALLDFVARGGQAIVTIGHENRGALAPVFRELGVEIPFEPLGPFRTPTRLERDNGERLEADFLGAWPIKVAPERACDPLVTAWGHCVLASVAWGRGDFLLVADRRFFCCANLEGIGSCNQRNVAFSAALLERTKRKL
jgi:hypothetical protein